MSTNRKIAKASAILISASSLGYILSLFKEIMVANYFGITKAMDAFYAAITFPSLINNVLLTTFGAVFIPLFVRYRLKDRAEAERIAAVTFNYLVLFLVLVAVILALGAPWIIRYGFHGLAGDTAGIAVHILRILCITVVLSGAIGVMVGILNAQEHFSSPAFSNMTITAGTILCIALFVNRWGVFVLPYGLLFGLVVQLLVLAHVLKRRGYRFSLALNAGHPAVKEMLSLSYVYFWAIIAAQVNLLVDRVMASYLASGSIAALGYAEKLIQVPMVIFTGSIATAVYPFFSSQVAGEKIGELKDSLAKSIRISGLIFMPLTAMLIVLAGPLVRLIFQRGAFGRDATALTSALLICYSLQLFFYTAGIIIIRVFLAFQEMAVLVKVALAGMCLNALLNVLFIRLFQPPAVGIALS
ncbi:MAG: murein biosynthesis integral membrane protein MurJ, partial [bacterium]